MSSPFLPGGKVQFAWDSTSLGWLKTCPRLYQYNMIEGWTGKAGVHLEWGLLYHRALECYDKERAGGLSHDDSLCEAVYNLLRWTWDEEKDKPKDWDHPSKTRFNLIRSVIWYLEEFEYDPAQTIILANGLAAVELSFRFEVNDTLMLCGHLDRLVNFNDAVFVMDRKTTTGAIGSYYFDGYEPDNQMSLYTLASRIVYSAPVRGVIIDACQVGVGFTRFARGFTFRTDTQLEEWLDDTKRWVALAKYYAEQNYWPQNDKACHHYGGCAYRKVCSKSPEVRQAFLESDFTKKEWNPLVPR